MRQSKQTTHSMLFIFALLLPHASIAAEFKIAVRAHAGEQRAFKKWQATIDHIQQALPAHTFVMLPYTSLKQQLADAQTKGFDFILTNPATYVEMKEYYQARALLTLVNNRQGSAQDRFGSVIFTHIDNTDIRTIADLKDKTFVGVNSRGFGGWRVAWLEMRRHGIEPERDFAELRFAGSQPKTVMTVLQKQAHAGSVRTDMLERLAQEGRLDLREVRILNQQETPGFPFFHSTPLYPEWPFAALPHVPDKVQEQVSKALLAIKATHPAAKKGKYIGWKVAVDYDAVKRLLQALDIPPFKKKSYSGQTMFALLALTIIIALVFLYRYSYTTSKNR